MARIALPLLFALAACSHATKITTDDKAAHGRALVVDAHSHVGEAIAYEGYDFMVRHTDHHEDLPRMREGGLDAEFLTILVHPDSVELTRYFGEALKQIDHLKGLCRANPKDLAFARTAEEVRANEEKNVVSLLLGVEGGHMLLPGSDAEQLEHLRDFADAGVRYLTLSWSSSSPLGGSSAEDNLQGITELGKKVVAEMQKLGMVIDLSHASDPLFWDVIRLVHRPVILSNSNARALANHPRNASDAMLEAISRNGGAICANFSRSFLDDKFRAVAAPLMITTKAMHNSERVALYQKQKNLPDVPVSKLIDHLEYMIKIAGIDHVCLGSDFDGVPMTPNGLEDVSRLPIITAELRKRGHTATDIEKILGGNILRVLEANEAPAAKARPRE